MKDFGSGDFEGTEKEKARWWATKVGTKWLRNELQRNVLNSCEKKTNVW